MGDTVMCGGGGGDKAAVCYKVPRLRTLVLLEQVTWKWIHRWRRSNYGISVLKYGPRNSNFPLILKRMICQLNLIIFNFKALGLILIKLHPGLWIRSMQQQLGNHLNISLNTGESQEMTESNYFSTQCLPVSKRPLLFEGSQVSPVCPFGMSNM